MTRKYTVQNFDSGCPYCGKPVPGQWDTYHFECANEIRENCWNRKLRNERVTGYIVGSLLVDYLRKGGHI